MIAARGRPITIACRRSNVRVAYTICERRVGCGKLIANVLCYTEFLRQSRKWFSWFWLNDTGSAYAVFLNRRSGYGTFLLRDGELQSGRHCRALCGKSVRSPLCGQQAAMLCSWQAMRCGFLHLWQVVTCFCYITAKVLLRVEHNVGRNWGV